VASAAKAVAVPSVALDPTAPTSAVILALLRNALRLNPSDMRLLLYRHFGFRHLH
jgi:hypothetical protein